MNLKCIYLAARENGLLQKSSGILCETVVVVEGSSEACRRRGALVMRDVDEGWRAVVEGEVCGGY